MAIETKTVSHRQRPRFVAQMRAAARRVLHFNDTPLRVAAGFGIGVFTGIFPGMGPLAATVLATLFRASPAAALAGSLITNTWLSLFTLLASLQVGAWLTGLSVAALRQSWQDLLKDFSWQMIWDVSVVKIIVPVLLGYVVIGLAFGIAALGISWLIVSRRRQERSSVHVS
ncbi:MAG: DUF2062 domain-containing protein [Candidatus Omnitrophica bacterium]|nr:DUF2062 domain-containing protein [Candidatus Omnitrophota bacterium]